jgi:acyl-CoA dehydrogenase
MQKQYKKSFNISKRTGGNGSMDFDLSQRSRQWRERLEAFFNAELLPRHRDWLDHVRHSQTPPFMRDLQRKARDAGLWNLGLPDLAADEPGTRLSNLDYAPLAEIMGRLPWASEVFNCQPPDVPNMIALQNCANREQKDRWLRPLLNAETRSAFAMTEPDVASSDATNIATTITRAKGGVYVVNGRKWFITGAAHPDCSFLIVLGVSDPQAARTQRHSCIIVPMKTKGVRLVRRLRWMGCEDYVAPIGELELTNVTVPAENLLGREGDGFKAAQVRLGPARLHHCMRSIGTCEVLIELMMARAAERTTFGRAVIDYDTVQGWIAHSRAELEQARLLTYRCAWLLDRDGHHGAWRDVSIVKIVVPAMLQRIADRAMQVFGAMGGSDDTPIHQALAWGRLLRIGDGPDEVHLRQVFRMEHRPSWSIAESPYLHTGTRKALESEPAE